MADTKPTEEKSEKTVLGETVALEKLATAGAAVQGIFSGLKDTMSDAGITLSKLNNATQSQVDSLGLMMSAIRKSKDLYVELGGAAGKSFHGFNEQTKSVLDSLGATESALGKTLLALSQNADNAIRVQKGYLSLAASTGELGQVFNAAGDELENLGTLVAAQGNNMLASAAATSSSMTQVQGWYKALGSIPGALKEVVNSNEAGAETTSMLTAAIKVAHGTGREFEDVMKDITEAYDKYGLKGEAALRFSVRMTDVSNSLGARMSTVTTALNNVASAFGGMVDQGESAGRMMDGNTNIMNKYASALKETGISGDRAAGIAASMVTEISKLNVAQKALLSAQTGGPGGLLGSVQIDRLIREGKTEEVVGLVQKAMTRQLGPIITQEEVKTEADAERFTAQKLMLQQGPLGALAKDEDSAARLLEAMKAGKIEDFKLPTADKTVQKAMEQGTKIEETTTTEFTRLYNFFEQSDFKMAMSNLAAMQGGYGARNTFSKELTPESQERQKRLRVSQREMAQLSGNVTTGYSTALSQMGDIGKDLDVLNTKFAISSFKGLGKGIEGVTKDSVNAPKQLAEIFGKDWMEKTSAKIDKDIDATYKEQNELLKKQAEAENKKLESEPGLLDKIKENKTRIGELQKSKALIGTIEPTAYNTILPEDQLQETTVQVANAAATEQDKANAAATKNKEQQRQTQHTHHLEVTAICLGCQTKLKTGQVEGTAPGARGGP